MKNINRNSILLTIISVTVLCTTATADITIPTDTLVGTWDSGTRTYTLTTDVNETLFIDESNLTLDGNGYSVTGSGDGIGIFAEDKDYLEIQNFIISGFDNGIFLYGCNNCIISGNKSNSNNASGDSAGIRLFNSSNNILTLNQCGSNRRYGILLESNSNDNQLIENIASGNINTETFTDGIHVIDSDNNTLTGNITNSNQSSGIVIVGCDGTYLSNNVASGNLDGICLQGCFNSTLEDNLSIANNNILWGFVLGSGIRLLNSSTNTISGNTCNSSLGQGIYLHGDSCENQIYCNTMSDNLQNGIQIIDGSNFNIIYNNSFIDNTTQANVALWERSGNIFTLDQLKGGNYWSDWTMPDANRDGFVDHPYVFNGGQDALPLTTPVCLYNPQVLLMEQLIIKVESVKLQQGISNNLEADADYLICLAQYIKDLISQE